MPNENIDEKQDSQKAEPEAEAKDKAKAEPQPEEGDGGEVADKHGQPGINREKYARDMKARELNAGRKPVRRSTRTAIGLYSARK